MHVRSDPSSPTAGAPRVISCDDCVAQHSSRCGDCVVTYFVAAEHTAVSSSAAPIALDLAQEHAVQLLARAGLIPELQHRLAG